VEIGQGAMEGLALEAGFRMNPVLLRCLRCPFCGGNLIASEAHPRQGYREYDVLTCYCGRYPVVAGIPILKRDAIGTAGQLASEVIALIEAGRHAEALVAMVVPSPASPALAPTWVRSLPAVTGINRVKRLMHQRGLRRWREYARGVLANERGEVTASGLFDLYFRRAEPHPNNYDYFAFRFGQPRHLIALSLASIIDQPAKPVLDLACGFGHISRNLRRSAKQQPVVGIDRSFSCLYVAKNCMAPEGEYVCAEADTALPFMDDAFAAAYCSDAFHFFTNKATSIREIKRVTGADGLIVLTGLRNALLEHLAPGVPMPPAGYKMLVEELPHRLVADSEVLGRYLQRQGPPLGRATDIARLTYEPLISVVASRRPDIFQDYGTFNRWPHAEGRLRLNPLYRQERRDGGQEVRLHRVFPSAFYEEENAECKEYLPEEVVIDSKVLIDLDRGERTAEVEGLIAQCVVLGMPERY
jgi:ubiquinone/menaquinone biosynthesis C-methylase UbiE/uncharacterized protein YbaR (Trm112 family)